MNCLLALLLALPGTHDMSQKNLVLIVVDQLSYWATDPAQRAPLEMPNLDALAEQGIVFKHAFATSPVCSANRLALLTGQYPFALGTNKLEAGVETLGTLLTSEGYDTGYIGKWHLSPVADPSGYVHPEDRPGWRFFAGKEGAPHDYTTGFAFKGNDPTPISTAPWEPTWYAQEARRFLRAERNKPFALVINLDPPHPAKGSQGYNPPEQTYLPNQCTPRPNVNQEDKQAAKQRYADYLSLCATTDNELGVLMAEIDLATTFVVLTSDHGDMLYSHGTGPAQQKRRPYQECLNVPLIIAGPGVARDRLLSPSWKIGSVDVLPTALNLLDIDVPSYVQGAVFPSMHVVYFGHDQSSKSWLGERWRGVYSAGFKYAVSEGGTETLHDLIWDPYEMDDISEDPTYADTLELMRNDLQAAALRIEDPWR